jgi:ribosomal protein S18 acetylase RimI-like enzyme
MKKINEKETKLNKKIYLLYSLTITTVILSQIHATDAPSVEHLLNADTVEITFKCQRDLDKRKVDMEKWLKIATAVDTLIKECYTYPAGKEWDELYKKVFDTVLFVHNEHSNPAGMHVDLLVTGQTLKEHRIIIHQNHEYTLTNDLDDTQIDRVLDLCHQTWWAKERSRQELDIILRHSLYFALIDSENQKIIGFIRAVSDFVRNASIFDVIIDEAYQGKGLGRLLVNSLINHPKLQKVPYIELQCRDDKVSFYQELGFDKNFGNVVPMVLNKRK